MNNNNQPWYCSWWAIIVAFLFFWPVGIVLLILRNNQNKQSIFLGSTNKKLYIIAGIVLIFLGICSFSSSKMMGFFMIVGGIALIVYAEKLTKKAQRNRQYIELIVNQGETSLDKIASICNIQYDKVLKELTQLVNVHVLKNAVIDTTYRTITIQKMPVQQQDPLAAIPNMMNTATVQNETVTCTCSGCGAKVMLPKGAAVNCDYCDTPICAK